MAVPVLEVVHVNVNCSNLERSLRFYRDVLGLRPFSHTRPLPQEGRGFGLDGAVQWDAVLLHDSRGLAGPAVDLLEWKQPPPAGSPYPEANHLGWFRLCLGHPDLASLQQQLLASGVSCVSAPQEVPIDPDRGLSARFFCCRDPDGTMLEFMELGGAPRLLHANVNCSDLAHSAEWYRRVLGLEVIGRSRPGPVSGEGLGLDGRVEWNAEFLTVPGRADSFVIDLLEWHRPRPMGRPYAAANHLGLYRLAFLVEDVRACHDELRRLGVDSGAPVWLDMGPDIPIDGLWALFFADPDGSCLELIQRPVVRA